jgi:hypothetical protein
MGLRISQFATAIPVIGYLPMWSGSLQHFLEAHPALQKVQLFSVLGRLKLIYLGSIFLAVSWGLYLYYCPKVIKRHQAEEDYLAEQAAIHDFLHVNRVREIVRAFVGRATQNVDPSFTERAPRTVREAIPAYNLWSALDQMSESNRTMVLRAHYLSEEIKNEGALRLCALVITLGLMLLAIPSVETFVIVMWKFFLFPG